MKARLVISFDFELGWGVLDSPDQWKAREQSGLYRDLRPVLAKLFKYLARHQIPTTWAAVSCMTLDAEADLPVDHLPASYRQALLDFFRQAAWETRNGSDLLESWQQELAPFSELGSHTATHLYASYPGVSADHYVKDVAISIEQLEEQFGTPIESFIFTRDESDFSAEVAAHRPMNLRLGPEIYGNRSTSKFSRILRGGTRFLQAVPESRVTWGPHGECLQTGSFYFNWSGGDFESVKRLQIRGQARRMLRQSQKRGGTYHVWLHPFNLAESAAHFQYFFRFLEKARRLRDSGRLEILTMRDCGRRPSSAGTPKE